MTIIERDVRCAAIETSLRQARHPGHDPVRWALPLIAQADSLAGGAWSLVVFDADEAGALWLAPHAGEACHGDTMRLGGESAGQGLRVADAAAWLTENLSDYASANPSCWGRVVSARQTDWGPIVVAPFPVGDRTAPTGTPRIVIDGLHRALGWALRPADSPLKAYVAGPAVEGAGVDYRSGCR